MSGEASVTQRSTQADTAALAGGRTREDTSVRIGSRMAARQTQATPLLAARNAGPFRVSAYRHAADAIEQWTTNSGIAVTMVMVPQAPGVPVEKIEAHLQAGEPFNMLRPAVVTLAADDAGR